MMLMQPELPRKLREYKKAVAEDMPYPQLLQLAMELVEMMETELCIEGIL